MKIYIGCDVGTSSTKAVAVDENGKVWQKAQRNILSYKNITTGRSRNLMCGWMGLWNPSKP